MFKSYFIATLRNIRNNKFYSFINITGLTTGLVAGLFILLWVQDEYSFNTFHKQQRNIYRISINGGGITTPQLFNYIIAPAATFAKNELPEVRNAVRIMPVGNTPFIYKDKSFLENDVAFADPTLFSVFDFPLIAGNPRQPFTDDASIVISRSVANRYFGKENPIGKMVIVGKNESFHVSGVINDMPGNSDIHYDVVLPLSRFNRLAYQEGHTSYNNTTRIASMDADWHSFNFATYLLLKPETDITALEKKLQQIHERNKPDDAPVPYLVQPIAKMHLYTADGNNAGIKTVRIFSVVALLILLVACINYINLSTARAMLRAREVSLRKIIGANRWQLFIQFLAEVTLLFVLATLLAIVLMFLLLPLYNNLAGKQLSLSLSNKQVWLTISAALLGTLVSAGIYPALLLSSFQPIQALQGKLAAGIGNVAFRRTLVVMQFSVSVILIISTLVIGKQLHYIYSRDLGYNKENIIRFPMRDNIPAHYETVKAQLLQQPGVLGVTRTDADFISYEGWTGDNEWEGKPANSTLYIHPVNIDETTIPFFHMQMAQGSNFTGAVADSTHFIINEAAARAMNMKDAVGKPLRIRKVKGTITGVVKDFHYTSMRKQIEPLVFTCQPSAFWQLAIKTNNAQAPQAIAAAEKIWKQYNSQVPFNFHFMDEDFNRLYNAEQKVGGLSRLFAIITIILSCLGLLGLATYSAQVKTKEIGIRKVLGASLASIIQLLTGEFIMLVLLSLLIAVPLAWYAMSKWLNDFAYHASIDWSIFAIAGISAIAIAFITVSVQSCRAALANPVNSLKNNEGR
ncbi:putative ABC transport system permease protein [Filimonas lacunae]|uniref:Putative ABC transport system permease protein n=1 Tax=Filimonas lacunae TaxID=477680 RepID=A0A173MA05_9BACT|nr:ABC transporter permease [Filimonas lacunae]BAV04367.1 ABC transporter, permease protein [Filimonas lacunae]SIT31165.1 putative ABC transport system permease protein [Filimonas lacunae]